MLRSLLSSLVRHVTELFEFLIELLLPSLAVYLPKVDHFAPHEHVRFEGVFSRITLEDGSSITVIMCGVNGAKKKPYYLNFVYHPSATSTIDPIAISLYPDSINAQVSPPWADSIQPYRYSLSPNTYAQFEHGRVIYRLSLPEIEVSIDITNMTRLFDDPLQTPHGPLRRLPSTFPLHWHILTTFADAQVSIKKSGEDIINAHGKAHVEKNWGLAFPSGWTWTQAFNDQGSFALAGGQLLGAKSCMLVVRLPGLKWDFRPPGTLMVLNRFSFGFEEEVRKDGLKVTVSDWKRRVVLEVKAKEDVDRWQTFNTPARDGHNNSASSQTHSATASLIAYERKSFWSDWKEVRKQAFANVALELGGSYRQLETKSQ